MTNKKLIMLVEDEDSIRILARLMLERKGEYRVDDYSHGHAAYTRLEELKLKEQRPYDLILSDIDMPQMNGLALAEEAHKLFPETPFIIMTGKPRDSYPKSVKGVLEKPFQSADLYGMVEKYIKK